jgi:hypothetical protein
VSNLYLTVQVPGPGEAAAVINPGVIQDVKFVPGTAAATAKIDFPAAERQQWLLIPVPTNTGEHDLFLVESRAAPGKVLIPADPAHAGPAVLSSVPLGTPPGIHAWKVTSPALGS